jgi:acyl-CoA thioesterase-2
VTELAEVLAALDLNPVDGTCTAKNLPSPGAVVFGGQMLAQSIVAASRVMPGKSVRSIHSIFARGAAVDTDLSFAIDVMHEGRAMGSVTVTASQGDRLCARSMLLLSAEEPDLVRHEAAMPDVPGPLDSPPTGHEAGWWETRMVDGVDINDPSLVGPAELFVWSRAAGDVPDDQAIHQALLAYATEGFLIATAMRPHEGLGQSLAHRTISTSVLSHTVTFHDPVRADAWTLLAMESPHASRGRSFGRAQVFDPGGHHIGSFSQENMVRAAPERVGTEPMKY